MNVTCFVGDHLTRMLAREPDRPGPGPVQRSLLDNHFCVEIDVRF